MKLERHIQEEINIPQEEETPRAAPTDQFVKDRDGNPIHINNQVEFLKKAFKTRPKE